MEGGFSHATTTNNTRTRTVRVLRFEASGQVVEQETVRTNLIEPETPPGPSEVRKVHNLPPLETKPVAVQDASTQTEPAENIAEAYPIPPDEFVIEPGTGRKLFTITLRHPSPELRWTVDTVPEEWRGDYDVLIVDAKLDNRMGQVHLGKKGKVQIKIPEVGPAPLSGMLFPIHLVVPPSETRSEHPDPSSSSQVDQSPTPVPEQPQTDADQQISDEPQTSPPVPPPDAILSNPENPPSPPSDDAIPVTPPVSVEDPSHIDVVEDQELDRDVNNDQQEC